VKQGLNRSARSADKSFASLYKGCGIPKGGALWSRPQARNTPGRAFAAKGGKQPVLILIRKLDVCGLRSRFFVKQDVAYRTVRETRNMAENMAARRVRPDTDKL